MKPFLFLTLVAALIYGQAGFTAQKAFGAPAHGISMHGNLKHKADFEHFGFVNPDAPKGGKLVYGAIGGFDSLNPFIVRGRPAPNLRNYIFESLMTRAYDEPFSLYGLLAKTIETPEDRSWVAFKINKNAQIGRAHV